MNYGRKEASKKQRKLSSKAARKKKRMGVRFFKAFLIICLIIKVIGINDRGIKLKKIYLIVIGIIQIIVAVFSIVAFIWQVISI